MQKGGITTNQNEIIKKRDFQIVELNEKLTDITARYGLLKHFVFSEVQRAEAANNKPKDIGYAKAALEWWESVNRIVGRAELADEYEEWLLEK